MKIEMRLCSPCRLAACIGAALLVAACTRTGSDSPTAAGDGPVAASAAAPAKPHVMACAMVPRDAMSEILGGAVTAKPSDRSSGQTQCIYDATAGVSPHAELKIEWGEGRTAMSAVGLANKAQPGITSPLEGLGDEAAMVGPTLMIRSGEDLVTIIFSGVDDAMPKARKVFALVKAQL